MSEEHSEKKLFKVKPWGKATREAKKLFASTEEYVRVLGQLRLLKHWPPPIETKVDEVVSFTQEEITCSGVRFREIKFTKCGWLSHNKNLRVFAYIDDTNRTVWIIYGYWKSENDAIADCIKRKVARRVNNLRAWLQEGGGTA